RGHRAQLVRHSLVRRAGDAMELDAGGVPGDVGDQLRDGDHLHLRDARRPGSRGAGTRLPDAHTHADRDALRPRAPDPRLAARPPATRAGSCAARARDSRHRPNQLSFAAGAQAPLRSRWPASQPPSRTIAEPVMKAASSEHIQTTALAISSGRPSRPMGSTLNMAARDAGLMVSPPTIAVSTNPGQIAQTRTPRPA